MVNLFLFLLLYFTYIYIRTSVCLHESNLLLHIVVAVNACSAQICEGPILGDVDLCIQYPTINVEHEDFCLFFPIEHLERVSITGSQLVFAYENTSKPLHHGKWVFELLTNFEFLETLQNMMRCWKSIKELDDVLADNEQSLLVRETSSILKSRPRQAQGYNTTPTRSASTRSTHKHEEVNFWRRGSESDLCTRMGPHNHLDESQFRSYSQSRLYQHNGTTHDNPEMAAKGIRPASTSPLNDLSRGVSNTFIGCENGTGTCIIQPSITSSSSNSTRSSVASQASNIMDPQGYSQHSEIRFGQFEASATEDFIESDYPSASMDDNDGEQNWLQCSWPRQRSRKRLHLCDTDYSLSRENSFSGRSMSPPLSRPRSASTRSTESYHPRRRGYTVNSYSFVSQENGHIYEELNHFDNKDAALHGLNRSPISPEMNGKASPCFSHGTSPVLDNDPARLQFGDPIAVMRNHSWRTVAQKQQSLVIPQQHISRQASCSSFYTDEHRSINNDSRPSTAGTFPSCHSGDLSGRCIDNGPVPPPPPPRPPHLRYHSSPHYVDRKSHHHALEQDYYRLDSFSRSKSQMFPEPIDLQLNGEASHRTQEEENLARSPTPIPSQHTQQSSEELQDAYASGNENTASPSSGEHLYVTLQEVQDCNLYIV